MTASPASPQPVNVPVTLTATATGGSHVEYKFEVRTSTTTYSLLRDWSTDNTATWTPTTPGGYYLRVSAREQGTTKVVMHVHHLQS